ncbi:long-chain fatty acid--CoA ligase [Variovorax sp. J22R133]|uniref:long-chain-fatty-acid--CoA ligase n=1 Tax=Variovorax brevis TaxID=3053503 RepID=UPI002577A9E7|nr:long-chain fatty acid--CoA ligase [Variovorax sp. J22R133]MDM0111140.1 long-chain fatty acid--CoA ligase [Variovorax sp. J22R133]
MLNIAANLQRSAALLPNKPAICFLDKSLTYSQLNAAANQVANGLRAMGIQKGDKVVLACPNLPFFPVVYYGILKAGAVVVPINVLLKAPEIAFHLKDSQAKAFFCFEGSPELPLGQEGAAGAREAGTGNFIVITADPTKPSAIEGARTLGQLMSGQPTTGDYEQTSETDTAVILYTSGTTGKPKGAELSHANLALNIANSALLGKVDSKDTYLITLPLFHSFGQTVQMNAAVMVGATAVLLPRFEPDAAFAAMQRHGVTIFAGVPTMFIALLNLPGAKERHDIPAIAAKMRVAFSGGAAMPTAVMTAFEKEFGVMVLEGFGLSETSPVASFSFMESEREAGSVGQPLYGVEIKLVDESGSTVPQGERGEICIRGHNVMKGYFNRPEATADAIRDGWFHSGDIGQFNEKGNLFIVDRVKDMIIRGGFNVYPRELEEVLSTHPAVATVAVIGVPHDTHGEEIKAVLVLKPGQKAAPDEVLAWCKERMAGYKYPRIIEIVESLPMTATGKILKRELRTNAS